MSGKMPKNHTFLTNCQTYIREIILDGQNVSEITDESKERDRKMIH